MHGFKRGTGCGPLRLTLAWAEAMKNWSWDRIRYVISPSHHVFGELQINALRAEVPLMPDTYWTYGRQAGSYHGNRLAAQRNSAAAAKQRSSAPFEPVNLRRLLTPVSI